MLTHKALQILACRRKQSFSTVSTQGPRFASRSAFARYPAISKLIALIRPIRRGDGASYTLGWRERAGVRPERFLEAAQATEDCVNYRRMSPRHPKLQDLHRPRQQREAESDNNSGCARPESEREGKCGRAVGDKMPGHTWQAGVRSIGARDERQYNNCRNTENIRLPEQEVFCKGLDFS